jgi:hypothetical protein
VNINVVIVEKNPDLGFLVAGSPSLGSFWMTSDIEAICEYTGSSRLPSIWIASAILTARAVARPWASRFGDGRCNRRGRAGTSRAMNLGYRVTTSDKDAHGAEDEGESVETRQYRHGASIYGSLPLSFSSSRANSRMLVMPTFPS